MKKIFFYSLMLGLACGFTACDTDNDDNPTLSVDGVTLTLNTPSFANGQLDLLGTTAALTFEWSATGYQFPYVTDYTLQVSSNEAFSDTLATAMSTTGVATVSANDLNTALLKSKGWTEEDIPASLTLYARVTSVPNAASVLEQYRVISNTVQFTAVPSYVKLDNAAPVLWYLLGGCIGNGGWSNSADNTYVGNIPMFLVDGCEYDAETGTGDLTYTGYFLADQGFKILTDAFDWNYGMCGNGTGAMTYRNGGDDPGNISVAADGYYQIDVNTKSCSGTITALDITPAVYESICLSGSFNDWGDTPMTAIHTYDGAVNHDWYLKIDLSTGDEIKFKMADSWDSNWGYSDVVSIVEWGYGSSNASNIGIGETGTYVIYFNDITGYFNITKQ